MKNQIIESHNRAANHFFFRVFLESNFLLSFGFILALVLQTLWIIGRLPNFSPEKTPIVFRNAVWALFSISLFCFLSYFAAFYFFILTKRIEWLEVKKTLITVAVMVILTIAILQISLIKVSFKPLLSNISQDKMFVIFFPFLIFFAFFGISGATTFFVNFKRKKLIKSNPKVVHK